jgi:hypothetical protein
VTPDELEAEFIRLSQTGELDKIQRILRSRRVKVPRDVTREIVQEAGLEVVRRQRAGGKITNVAGLVMTIATRMLEKAWEQLRDGLEVEAEFARRERAGGQWQHDDAWQARIERAVEYVFKAVANWPADNLRRTLMTIIDAAVEGVQLEPHDLDELFGCARGTSAVWRRRAYDRLRVQFERDGISWEEATGLLLELDDDDGDARERDDIDEEES